MRAIVQSGYGAPEDVLSLQDIGVPQVRPGTVLVRVLAASLHPDIWHVVHGVPQVLRLMGAGVHKPKQRVPGTDLSGFVVATGAGVTRFQPGEAVFGESVTRHQWQNGGAFAEYALVPESGLVLKPDNVTFEQAAAVPTSGIIALHSVGTAGRLSAGQRVLVNGAAGGVGMFSVLLAKAAGAEVTAVDRTDKLDMLRSIGADAVIDYSHEDFTQRGERYDLIVDIPGNHPYSACRRALSDDGLYVLVGHDNYDPSARRRLGSIPRFAGLAVRTPFSRNLPKLGLSAPSRQESLTELSALLAAGQLTPSIDRTYPLAEIHAAMRYLASGAVRGKVVLTTADQSAD